MRRKQIDHLILQMESHLECWKQFNHYLSLARGKKFNSEDETQFLEVKSVLAQELEIILSLVECVAPTKEDIHNLLASAPSVRYLSELNDGALRGVENQWHRIYIAWQSLLGQLKVKRHQIESKSVWASLTHSSNGA
jgi:hypothetical protein